ncbi:Rab family GTPase [Oxynema aestuarii]|jgi:small GTP-binding protein|uniref:GTP-binding protein n=1 Tax=Oxynema aestuarii AP17 TaxID=2064643 RepID=A0A6H1TZB9_9CYAN|nr:Rab family GTPase [Oxynema aestuarii]QIZ71934.1 GTP-binding protein [Oxynema aestuarii AP17]
MSKISKKMCMIGDFGVGKTSLIRRFVEREFSDRYLSTVGVKISRKTVELTDVEARGDVSLQLLIWDLEGHTKFKAIAPSYLQGSSGALVVADLTREETVDRIDEHIKLFASVNKSGSVAIALNKTDLVEPEKLPMLLGIAKASLDRLSEAERSRAIATFTTSAKTGKDVDSIFEKLSYTMLESAK